MLCEFRNQNTCKNLGIKILEKFCVIEDVKLNFENFY